MGYDRRAARQAYTLPFEDYPGLVVRVLAPSFGGELASARVARVEARGLPVGVWLAEVSELLDEFADALVSWTLTEGGRPVPTTAAELRRLDRPFLMDLLRGWALTLSAPAAQSEEDAPTPVEDVEPPEVALGLADMPHMPPLAPVPDWPAEEPVDGQLVDELVLAAAG